MSDGIILILIKSFVMVSSLMIIGYLIKFIYSFLKKRILKTKESMQKDNSLLKAVYNHSKDIASEIKPKIEEYKENHKTTNSEKKLEKHTNINKEILKKEEQKEPIIKNNNKVKNNFIFPEFPIPMEFASYHIKFFLIVGVIVGIIYLY